MLRLSDGVMLTLSEGVMLRLCSAEFWRHTVIVLTRRYPMPCAANSADVSVASDRVVMLACVLSPPRALVAPNATTTTWLAGDSDLWRGIAASRWSHSRVHWQVTGCTTRNAVARR